MAEIVQRGHQRPAVHLPLIDLLGAVIKPCGIAKADGVGGGKQAEIGVGGDHFVLVQECQLAVGFQNPLDHEHHVGAAGVIFIKHDRRRIAQCPGQDAFVKFGDLHAVAQFDGVFADQINPADMAVEVDAHARPVEARGHLLDMGGFAGAVIALQHDPAVMGKPGQNRQRGIGVKFIGGVKIRHAVGALGKAFHDHFCINTKYFRNRNVFGWFGVCVDAAVSHEPGSFNWSCLSAPVVQQFACKGKGKWR